MNYSNSLSSATVTDKPITVLIVDDSALVRQILTKVFDEAPGIEVVGACVDPYDAREQIKKLNPDVLTLDVEMPKMDGVTFLKNLMRLRPMPVVMISSLTERGAEVTLKALELGAIDFVAKPKFDLAQSLEAYAEEIVGKVKMAARMGTRLVATPHHVDPTRNSQVTRPVVDLRTTERIVAIGSSTGGTEAVKDVFASLPANSPGIVVAQHIPPVFSRSFAERLNHSSALVVCEAADGQQIVPGHAYVAPGDYHLEVVRNGARYECRLSQKDPVNRHRPSVDVLFDSVAQSAGKNALGIILTGMGNDGAQGLKNMLDAGSETVAQDEKTSVVWGMPGRAVECGATERILPLADIAGEITKFAGKP